MDRFAEQLFGNGASSRSRDPPGLMETLAKTLAQSAFERAMEKSGNGTRGRGDSGMDAVDWHSLGGFVLQMMSGRGDKEKEKKKRSEDKKRKRHRERETTRDRDFDPDEGRHKRRRSERAHPKRSPHVTFAEPFGLNAEYYFPKERRRRRRHPEEEQYQDRHVRRRDKERRRSRRYRDKVDLRTLQTGLEDMSSTIIALNARSANHRDCEFYDKFVRRGGHLQEVIGSTLGQIRELEEEDGGRERHRRKRRRRER